MSTIPESSGILDLLESVKEIQAKVPPEERDKLPHDGSINTDTEIISARKATRQEREIYENDQ